jgi:hypothetical protein
LLLLQKDRAGNEKLREFYLSQIEILRLSRQRIPVGRQKSTPVQLTGEQLAAFHSHWYFYAVYLLLLRSPKLDEAKLASILDIGIEKIQTAIAMLIAIGLAVQNSKTGLHQIREGDVGVGRNSPYVDHIHRNFRLEAIKSLDKRNISDAHYSRYFMVSQKRAAEIQERFAQMVVQLNAMVDTAENTKEELILFGLCHDCFRY